MFSPQIEIAKEHLPFLLPSDLIQQALEDDAELGTADLWHGFASVIFTSPTPMRTSPFKPSPQVVPLESRIHRYLLRNEEESEDEVDKVDMLFEDFNFTGQPKPSKPTLYESLENEGFFVATEEAMYKYDVKKQKSKLSALASEFMPNMDWDKENIDPNIAKI